MTRHLAKCQAGHAGAKAVRRKKVKTGKLYHVLVQGKYNPQYWLHLELPATATLADLDAFLRDIWLECCGHLSAFDIGEVRYSVDADSADPFYLRDNERNMDVPVGKVFGPDLKFTHEYDYGSTTTLGLQVVGERAGALGKEHEIKLLARNEPPPILCRVCGQPAQWVDTCAETEEDAVCDRCLDGDDEGFLPVVNSPRIGVCGYAG
jgi:hypothetical protein